MNTSETNKQAAIDFLQMVVVGNIAEGYQKYVAMSGKHHNAFFAAGFPALKKAMEENHSQFPLKQMIVKNVLADGNLVAVHSHVIVDKQKMELAAVHILRFENGKIVEMWDIGHAIPKNLPNKDGLF